MRVQLLGARRIEVRPEAFKRRQPRLVLHHDGERILGNGEVEQVGQAQAAIRLAPQVPELFEEHRSSASPLFGFSTLAARRHPRISRGVGAVGRMRGGEGAQIAARAG